MAQVGGGTGRTAARQAGHSQRALPVAAHAPRREDQVQQAGPESERGHGSVSHACAPKPLFGPAGDCRAPHGVISAVHTHRRAPPPLAREVGRGVSRARGGHTGPPLPICLGAAFPPSPVLCAALCPAVLVVFSFVARPGGARSGPPPACRPRPGTSARGCSPASPAAARPAAATAGPCPPDSRAKRRKTARSSGVIRRKGPWAGIHGPAVTTRPSGLTACRMWSRARG